MLEIRAGENDACALIVLASNNSAGWKANQRFFNGIALVSLGVAVASAIHGAPLVMLFSGLELLALYALLRRVSKDCSRQQVIELTPYDVVVQMGSGQPENQWCWQRLHTRVEVKQSHHKQLVSLVCKDQKVRVGEFLTEAECHRLIKGLQRLVLSYRQLYL